MALAYTDLLNAPYKLHGKGADGYDCSTVCEEVLRRLGFDAPATSPFRIEGSSGALGEFEGYMDEARAKLTLLGADLTDAAQPGDLVLTSASACSVSRGMYVLAVPDLFLTATPRTGVTAVMRDALLRLRPTILGIYRCASRDTE